MQRTKDRDSFTTDSKKQLSPFRKQQSKANLKSNDEILFLKSKLLENHNKLLQQLEICKVQQQKMVQIKQENEELKEEIESLKNKIEANKFNSLENDYDNLKQKMKYESIQKNKAKEQLRYLTEKYAELEELNKQLQAEQKSQNYQYQNMERILQNVKKKNNLLQVDQENYINMIEDWKSQLNQSKAKMQQMERAIKEQRIGNKTLTQQNKILQGKVFNMMLKIQTLQQQNSDMKQKIYLLENMRHNNANNNKGVEKLKSQINFLNNELKVKEQLLKDQQRRKTVYSPIKKKDYNDTKQQLERLEKAQIMTRNKNHSSATKLNKTPLQYYPDKRIKNENRQITFQNDKNEKFNRYS